MPRAVRYRVLRKIAHGGMAEIFLALQTGAEGFQKPVVLKRILPAFAADPHFVRMLVDEAHIASSLSHSHLVHILDLGKSNGQFFLVLEFVDGWSLEQVRRRAQKARLKFPLPLALYIVSSLCRALSYVHRRGRDGKPLGIVHRDISPQNVLLGREGEVKLADFGIAKAVGRREKSATGIIKGKFAYMSPEQSIGSALDARSDLFSVGTLLYILTTGKKPFEAPTDLEVLMQVRRARFEKPSAFLKEYNLEVERFIGRALRADRARRWQSAEQMADRLDGILVKLGQPTGPAALKRWLEALSERDGIKPPGDLPEIESDISVGTIELETGDLELHDTGSGEIAMPARTRAVKTREATTALSASAVVAASSAPASSSSPAAGGSSISGTNYVSLSIVPAEATGAVDAQLAHASAASTAVSPPPASDRSPITVLGPTTLPAAAWPPDPTVRRPALFVLGEPAEPAPPREQEPAHEEEPPTERDAGRQAQAQANAQPATPAPARPRSEVAARPAQSPSEEAADTVASRTPPWEPIARPTGVAAAASAATTRYPIVFPPIRRARPPMGAPRPMSDAVVSVPTRGLTEKPRAGALTDPLARTAALEPAGSPASARPAVEIIPPPVAFVRPPPVAALVTSSPPPVAPVVADPASIPTPPPVAATPPPYQRREQDDDDEDSESVSVSAQPGRKPRRWRRRLLVAVTSVAILAGGGYFTSSYWVPRVAPYVAPSLPPWVIARMTRPIDTWLRRLPERLHLGPKQQVGESR